MSMRWPNKDKDETLDFGIDWTRVLEDGESLSSASWSIKDDSGDKVPFGPTTVVSSLQNIIQSVEGSVANIYLSGGQNNKEYTLYCSISTSKGRITERSVKIRIREHN